MEHAYVAIMAGGVGSRFWPKSRDNMPKQFLDILGTGKTLLQTTWDRFRKIVPEENIYILTNEKYTDTVREQLPGIRAEQIIGEPLRKNTAPCIAYFSHKIMALDPKACMVVAPSDHLVIREKEFVRVIGDGLKYVAENNCLLTLGIHPTRPDTGYGYIQFNEDSGNHGTYRVKTFTEKPDLELAKKFLASGDFLWNSGIFIWNGNTIIRALKKYLPEVCDNFSQGKRLYNTEREAEFVREAYSTCPSISIDYGVMEKATNVRVIPAQFGWSDLGTWASLYEHYPKDYYGNAVSGKKVMIYDASNCMVMVPDQKLVVLQGLDNFIVVDTEDALLICEKTQEQKIKAILADIKSKKLGNYL